MKNEEVKYLVQSTTKEFVLHLESSRKQGEVWSIHGNIYMVRGVGWVNRSVQSLSLIQTLHSQLTAASCWWLAPWLSDRLHSLVSAKLAVPSLPIATTAAMVAILNIFFIFYWLISK